MTNIPPGYQVHIRTWENDADHYQTKIVSGLNVHDVKMLVEIAQKFNSKNEWREGKNPGRGNGSLNMGDMFTILKHAFDTYGPFISENIRSDLEEIVNKIDEDEDLAADWAYEWLTDNILGVTVEYYDWNYFARVVEEIRVYYYPSEIEDQTAIFVG